MWEPARPDQPAHMLPPISNLASGPSGITYYPGTGLDPDLYAGKFLLADFRGQHTLSGVRSFSLRPRGATFEIVAPEQHLWNLLVTDLEFGPDGALYLLDWVQGWLQSGVGRIYRMTYPNAAGGAAAAETRTLLAEGFGKRSEAELLATLGHADARVRLEAQLELVARGAIGPLGTVAGARGARLARLHAIWGTGQLLRRAAAASRAAQALPLLPLIDDEDVEVRAQAISVLGDARVAAAGGAMERRLGDASPRVRFHAAIALGKLGRPPAGFPPPPLSSSSRRRARAKPRPSATS
jgi:quinoprotein glucose dehydrogenase